MLEIMDQVLPEDKPRYLMGVGTPEDLVNGISRGVDIFDCVLPTRLARHNAAMTRFGDRLNLVNASFAKDRLPIDEECNCYTCRTFSRAYLRHLIIAKEMLSATLISIHNLHTLITLANDIRQAIIMDEFNDFTGEFFQQRASLGLE
jgi:queuine tRNA-ribosyltransferase